MSEPGTVFPPRDAWEIAAYPTDDVVLGYMEHRLDDPVPGDNRSPGYRWGWANRRRDVTHEPDGFDAVRRAYFKLPRRAA